MLAMQSGDLSAEDLMSEVGPRLFLSGRGSGGETGGEKSNRPPCLDVILRVRV